MEQTYLFDYAWRAGAAATGAARVPLRRSDDEAPLTHGRRPKGRAAWRSAHGRGSVARWLAGRALTLALDLEIDQLDAGEADVLQGDVLEVEFPDEGFDLIHTRAVLTHVPERESALERMLGWSAPGGWIVLEELDWWGPARSAPSWTALIDAYARATPTIDWRYGRELLERCPSPASRTSTPRRRRTRSMAGRRWRSSTGSACRRCAHRSRRRDRDRGADRVRARPPRRPRVPRLRPLLGRHLGPPPERRGLDSHHRSHGAPRTRCAPYPVCTTTRPTRKGSS